VKSNREEGKKVKRRCVKIGVAGKDRVGALPSRPNEKKKKGSMEEDVL